MPTRFLYIERKKEQTNLKIDEHVTLKAIQDDSAYPELFGRVAGIETDWPTALINARNPHSANSRTAFSVKGLEHAKAENFTLENIHISAAKPGRIQNTKHWTFKNLTLQTPDNTPFQFENCDAITPQS